MSNLFTTISINSFLLSFLFIRSTIVLSAQTPLGYTLIQEAPGIQLYYNSLESCYVQVVNLDEGAHIESMLGRKEGTLYLNNTYYPKYKKHRLNDFWEDWVAEKGSDAFSVINGSFYWSDPTSIAAMSFPIKHRGSVKTIGFGNNEPYRKRLLKLKSGGAEIVDYNGLYPNVVETDSASNIIVGLEIGQKSPIALIGRTAVGVGGNLNNNGYSKIYLLTSATMSAVRVNTILQGFGSIQAMAFDGSLSSQIALGGYSMFFMDRPVPHAIGISAAPTPKTYSIENDDALPICGMTTSCNGTPVIGGVIQASAVIDRDQITFEVSKCNGTAFIADGKFYIREDICDEENYLIGGTYSAGQMSFKATAQLPSYFQPTCKTYYVIIIPSGQYVTGGINVCLQSIEGVEPNLQPLDQLVSTHCEPFYSAPHVQVNPNPTRGRLSVDLKNTINQTMVIELYSSMGKKLLIKEVPSGVSSLVLNETKDLPSGVYFLKLTAQGKLLESIQVLIY